MDSTPMTQFQTGMPDAGGSGVSMPPVSSQVPGNNNSPLPMVQQVEVKPEQKKDYSGLIKTIVIIILSLALVTFIGLFIWMHNQYVEASSDVDSKIALAIAGEKDTWDVEATKKCAEENKKPYTSFSGPTDYGGLSFKYPKTWSVFIQSDASKGGDFKAFLNPGQVDPISNENVNALRVSILDKAFDVVTKEYDNKMKDKKNPLSMESVTVNGITANLYSGTIPSTQLQGFILVFKIRDKTAVLQTDSVLFEKEFREVIMDSIKFNA